MGAPMSRPNHYASPVHLLAPRSYVPQELRNAYVGNLDEEGASAIAVIIKRKKLNGPRRCTRIVLVDIDSSVYAVRPYGASIDLFIVMHPELVVGTYDAKCHAADLAADLESVRRIG
jgi:hypothetical protein